ncbi:hypothetical protein NKDENANG_04010 [Candidatus Entotheonellaceae bacterium PAL068K]
MSLFVRHHTTTEDGVADLEQQLAQTQDKNDFFLLTIRDLLDFIKEFSLDLTEIDAEEFKQRVEDLSKHFVSEERTKKLQQVFEESKSYIKSYKERIYIQDKEKGFRNTIESLISNIQTFNSNNKEFTTRIYDKSSRLEEITYLNDIRKIKQELKQEVEQIRYALQDKQKRDSQRLEALTREVETLKVDFQQTKQASMTDGLTGVFNRMAFDAHVTTLVERNTVYPEPFALFLLDIDDFKQINDTHGHQIGDRVLLALVRQCQQLIRKDDFLARYGGEEFAIILPAVSVCQGLKKARSICESVAAARYALDKHEPAATVSFTVSIGVGVFRTDDTALSLIERADKALYEAKRLGKNRAVSEKQVGAGHA